MTAPSQQLYRNGTVSQDSLPLWYRISEATPTTSLLKHIPTADPFHNGSIPRDLLPLLSLRCSESVGDFGFTYAMGS